MFKMFRTNVLFVSVFSCLLMMVLVKAGKRKAGQKQSFPAALPGLIFLPFQTLPAKSNLLYRFSISINSSPLIVSRSRR